KDPVRGVAEDHDRHVRNRVHQEPFDFHLEHQAGSASKELGSPFVIRTGRYAPGERSRRLWTCTTRLQGVRPVIWPRRLRPSTRISMGSPTRPSLICAWISSWR